MIFRFRPALFNPAMACVAWISISGVLRAQAPAFDCGSNGSYGPISVSGIVTLQVPPDGIFHCTTFTVNSGNTALKLIRNANNTPVYILATGDVILRSYIEANGASSTGQAGGVGGPGGYDGGTGANLPGILGGAGQGPGGGLAQLFEESATRFSAGSGSYRVPRNGLSNAGPMYGSNLLIPLVGGSGGAGGQALGTSSGRGGGGGGGAILIASNTRIIFESVGGIRVSGGSDTFIDVGGVRQVSGTGSGGAIRLVAPIISGSTQMIYDNGRYRVDAYDRSQLAGTAPTSAGSVMVVFPNPMPKLSVVSAAGRAVAENSSGPVSIILPAGTNPTQSIQVRARDFGGVVPVRVRVVPETGEAANFDATIDNSVNNPANISVPVTLPLNIGVRVEVFTR